MAVIVLAMVSIATALPFYMCDRKAPGKWGAGLRFQAPSPFDGGLVTQGPHFHAVVVEGPSEEGHLEPATFVLAGAKRKRGIALIDCRSLPGRGGG